MTNPANPKVVRVAAYCRVSVAEREATDFGSLEAQREAIEAYVLSQRENGWVVVPDRYDDEGYSGGNTNRPGFQRLLRDALAGVIDVVAVYKFDRLSRRQLDFLGTIERLESAGVEFVSITQNLDTSTSMGRCMLNIMSAFAQLEREVIAERTRDKMQAARRRGMWTGGRPVLGFDVIDKRLVINEAESEQVRRAFRLYLELGSTMGVAEELGALGIRNKAWTTASGNPAGGRAFGKGTVNALLRNPLYVGRVRGPDGVCPGEHEAIVPRELWEAAQARLDAGATGGGRRRRATSDALLAGIARCHCGSALTPTRARKGGRSYMYYVCVKHQKEGAAACPGSRVASKVLEDAVIEAVREAARNPELVDASVAAAAQGHVEARRELTERISELKTARGALAKRRGHLIASIEAGDGGGGLTERVRELDGELAAMDNRLRAAKAELADLDTGQVEPERIREALAQFDGVWGALSLAERARAADLLLRAVIYDGRTGSIDIELRSDEGELAGRAR